MLLSEEDKQKILAERKIKSEQRLNLIKKLEHAAKNASKEELEELINQLKALDPDICEHGRSTCKPCLACDELEAQLYGYELPSDED